MSIADKITSITNHLTNDYEGISNLGVDLTNIDKNIENIRTCLDSIYSNLPKVTGTDGTEVTLTPTLKGKLNIQEKGNSTQDTTTGKNLYPTGTKFTPTQVIWVDNYGNDISTVAQILSNENYLDLTGGQAYTFKINEYANIKAIQVVYLDNSTIKTLVNVANDTLAHTFTPATNTRIWVRYSVNIVNQETYIIAQIEKGSTATDYEQYTGGIPAPNPSYPQTIKSVTGNNNVVVRTENLVNYNGTEVNLVKSTTRTIRISATNFPLTLEAGTYKFSMPDLVMTNNTYMISVQFIGVETSGTRLSNDGTRNLVLTETGTITELYIYINSSDNDNATAKFSKIMLNKGDTAKPYQPYGNQTLPLNLGTIELNKIGDYQDYIYKNNGNWYKHEEIKKKTFDGTETILGFHITTTGTFAVAKPSDSIKPYPSKQFLCNKFVASSYSELENGNVGLAFNPTDDYVYINKTGSPITDQTTAQVYASIVPFNLYYLPTTSTDIEITDTTLINQLEDIDKMLGYNGTTIITSTYDSNNAQMILGASSLKGE